MGHFPFYFEREKVLLDQSMCSLFYYLFLLLTCHENILSFLGAIENLYVANKVISSVLVEGYSQITIQKKKSAKVLVLTFKFIVILAFEAILNWR